MEDRREEPSSSVGFPRATDLDVDLEIIIEEPVAESSESQNQPEHPNPSTQPNAEMGEKEEKEKEEKKKKKNKGKRRRPGKEARAKWPPPTKYEDILGKGYESPDERFFKPTTTWTWSSTEPSSHPITSNP